jgi:replicative DNA helicase
LEQDADGVILIHRDPMGDSLILAKNRGGPTGIVNVEWIPHLTKFREI